jgi:UDP-N-acetylglucosamine--N-acetylmuramyl-(pentapeptide) pyrophosphoryl-undecaprenol N-acetylglucosamine transferase
MEKDILERFDIQFYSIPAGKLRRYFSFNNFVDIFKIIAGFIVSIFILKKIKADLVFSKGGFVTVPAVFAARLLRIPVISHESDLDPGLATRINGRFSEIMLFAYKETAAAWKHNRTDQKVIVTGNPVRKEIYEGKEEKGRDLFNIPMNKKIILVLGGSQGASEINKLIEGIIDKLCADYFVIHQMGALTFTKSIKKDYVTRALFDDEFPDILAAADLVVSRAGAGTLWENGVMSKPAILIPLGSGSSRGDQIRNADYFEAHGAAVVLRGDNLNSFGLLAVIQRILGADSLLKELEKNAELLCNKDSAEQIVSLIQAVR